MVKQKRTRTRVTAKEISASIEALDALLRSPPPPPHETITLARAIADLAPKIVPLLDAGYHLDQIADCIRLGGQPMLAAKLKRYLAGCDSRRRKTRGRFAKGTTPIRRKASDTDKSSSSKMKGSRTSGEKNAPTITTQPPPNAPASPISTVSMAPVKTAVSGTLPAQQISQTTQPRLLHSVFEAGLPPTTTRAPADALPVARPGAQTERPTAQPVRTTTGSTNAAQGPSSPTNAAGLRQTDEPRAQQEFRLLDAARARMDRGAPPGFDPNTDSEPDRTSSSKDERPF